MHPFKALGPDGFPGAFYRDHWVVINDQVVKAVQECFRFRTITSGLNRTFIVLVPKVSQPANFSQFRRISVCNFSYKIISRILVNRLRNLLSQIISLNQ